MGCARLADCEAWRSDARPMEIARVLVLGRWAGSMWRVSSSGAVGISWLPCQGQMVTSVHGRSTNGATDHD